MSIWLVVFPLAAGRCGTGCQLWRGMLIWTALDACLFALVVGGLAVALARLFSWIRLRRLPTVSVAELAALGGKRVEVRGRVKSLQPRVAPLSQRPAAAYSVEVTGTWQKPPKWRRKRDTRLTHLKIDAVDDVILDDGTGTVPLLLSSALCYWENQTATWKPDAAPEWVRQSLPVSTGRELVAVEARETLLPEGCTLFALGRMKDGSLEVDVASMHSERATWHGLLVEMIIAVLLGVGSFPFALWLVPRVLDSWRSSLAWGLDTPYVFVDAIMLSFNVLGGLLALIPAAFIAVVLPDLIHALGMAAVRSVGGHYRELDT